MKNRMVMIVCCSALVFFAGCQTAAMNTSTERPNQPRLVDFGHGICLDTVNGLMWQVKKSELLSSWQQAQQYTDNLSSAGFEDWRLPTYDELFILYKIFAQKKNGNCLLKLNGSVWTGKIEKNGRAGFWDSEPLCGGPSYFFIKRSRGSAIAVRMSTESTEP